MAARAESFGTLPGEISTASAEEKSAEAVVAKKPGNAGGAKGRRVTKEPHPVMGGSDAKDSEMRRSSNCGYFQRSEVGRAKWILAAATTRDLSLAIPGIGSQKRFEEV